MHAGRKYFIPGHQMDFSLAPFRIILRRPHSIIAVPNRLVPTMPESGIAQSLKSFEASEDCDAPLHNLGLVQAHRANGRACDPEEIELKVIGAYLRLAPSLCSYLIALCKNADQAQDAVQEAFLRYYIALTNGVKIHNDKAWLFRVARNYLLDRLKDHAVKNRVGMDAAEVSQKPACRPSQESECLWAEILKLAFGTLSSREKECLQLRAEGLNYREIAQVLNLRSGTVGTLLARGLKKITEFLSGDRRD